MWNHKQPQKSSCRMWREMFRSGHQLTVEASAWSMSQPGMPTVIACCALDFVSYENGSNGDNEEDLE